MDTARTGWVREMHMNAKLGLSAKADIQPLGEVDVDTVRCPLSGFWRGFWRGTPGESSMRETKVKL